MHIIKVKEKTVLSLSDTHGMHRQLDIPEGIDIVIHCGDICDAGDMDQLSDFFVWYVGLSIPHKVFVHGNHDLPFELEPLRSKKLIPEGIHWLNDSSIRINDMQIMGISGFPSYHHIESDVKIDIMVSHYPPLGILDNGCGSDEIREFVTARSPKYHIFGHNHAGYGKMKVKAIQFVNASLYELLKLLK
ncbi:metallophosphoesterase [Sphingobacterium sp. DR205]|uniref:metallophosphoesterase family protein n=1 Tax=Sphingobacterium sp. DR205 TaxID=2713573 RepID=UPI0013E525E5|nr:metallophosphoesterase [Sphingobacterium sp. DR205]QIH35515.1 serine/threonine protein phosphatase [Sphingobacterium sp. DR205]